MQKTNTRRKTPTAHDSASLSPGDRDRLAQAVATILTTKGAPVSLFNKVADFISEGISDDIRGLWKPPLIAHLIDRVNEREEATHVTN